MGSNGRLPLIYYLVGGFNPLKNMKVNGKDYPIYEMENTCLKPPTSYVWWIRFSKPHHLEPQPPATSKSQAFKSSGSDICIGEKWLSVPWAGLGRWRNSLGFTLAIDKAIKNGWFWGWYGIIYCLVVESYPSEKWWSSSVGMMTFPTEWWTALIKSNL